VLLLLGFACSTGSEGPPTDSSPGETASGDTGESGEDVGAPEWDPEQVAGFLSSQLARRMPEPRPAIEAYNELLSHAEPGCPTFERADTIGWIGWAGVYGTTCTTSEGWQWFGLAQAGAGCELDSVGVSMLDFGQVASYLITSPTGEVNEGGGSFGQRCEWTSAAGTCSGWFTGSFTYPIASDWLAEGAEGAVFVESSWEGETFRVELDGGMGYQAGTLGFDALVLSPEGVSGGIAVRDPGGYWHELPLDSDGCGNLGWRGQDEGRVCLDFSGWLSPPDPGAVLCSSL
jgi:hypothetical protein